MNKPLPMYILTHITHPLLLIPVLMYIPMPAKSSKIPLCYLKYSSIYDITGFDYTFDTFTSPLTHIQTSALEPLFTP